MNGLKVAVRFRNRRVNSERLLGELDGIGSLVGGEPIPFGLLASHGVWCRGNSGFLVGLTAVVGYTAATVHWLPQKVGLLNLC